MHAARKVVGVGSVGTRSWILLMVGRDDERPAVPPVQGSAGLGTGAVPREEPVHPARTARRRRAADDAGGARHHARVGANRDDRRRRTGLLHPAALGCQGLGGRRGDGPAGAGGVRKICGWTLARAHARSGDAIAIAAYLGSGDSFDRAMAHSPKTYADQNDRDYRTLKEAAASGRIVAETGV